MKIDLHMHTNLSDGELSVEELLNRLAVNNISLFSITDHNHAKAYDYIENNRNMIIGTELTTSYKGVIIEILGYKIDPKVINNWFDDFYSDKNVKEKEIDLFENLKALANKLGYKIPQDLVMNEIVKGESKKVVYYYLKDKYKDFEFATYKAFFRQALSNPNSDWFINEGQYYPDIKTVLDLIHQANGVAILAHPHEYGLDNLNELYQYLQDLGIDGIESVHPSASMKQSVEIVKYCEDNKLLSSGGSDFHRDSRLIPHGINVHPQLLASSCFDWLGLNTSEKEVSNAIEI